MPRTLTICWMVFYLPFVSLSAARLIAQGVTPPVVPSAQINASGQTLRSNGLVSIETLSDARGNSVRANVFTAEQAAINSAAINRAFTNMQNKGPQADGLYIPGKRFAVGPKIRLNYGYGGAAMFGTGSIGDGGTYWGSTNTAAHSALIKVSHFDEPVIEVPTVGARLDGFTIYGWHQTANASLPGKAIVGATNTSPIVITSPGHGLTTGAIVRIANVVGNAAANGTWTITKSGSDAFSLDGSVGSGDYAKEPTQGVWVAPGVTYATTGVRLARADAGSPNFNTWLGPLSIVGCDVGIAVDFDAGQDDNTDNIYCPKLNFGVFGDCVKVTNGNTTCFTVGHLRVGTQQIGSGATTAHFSLDNIFNYRKSGGLDAQFVNTNQHCTVLRTAEISPGASSFTISTLRFDSDSPKNRILVMEQPRGVRVRVGVQYLAAGYAITHPLVEWKHHGVIEGQGGYAHPDIEIDCHQWRRDQAAAYPRRPIAGWPMPLFFETTAYPSTKLWLTTSDQTNWTIAEQPADKEPRVTLRNVAATADRSGTGNHLQELASGGGPKLWAENFNHRDTLRFYSSVLYNDGPVGLDGVSDLEIMFPIMLLNDSNGGTILACGRNGQPQSAARGWGIRITSRHELQWHQNADGMGEQVVTSHSLETRTPYLAHVRRIGATGEVYLLVDNGGGQKANQVTSAIRPAATGTLTKGPLSNGATLSVGGLKQGPRGGNVLEALIPDLFVDTALLSRSQLAERKRYLRAAYGVWEGTQLDQPSHQ